jgi:hypothetical protein
VRLRTEGFCRFLFLIALASAGSIGAQTTPEEPRPSIEVRSRLLLQSAAPEAPSGKLLLRPLFSPGDSIAVPVEKGAVAEVRLPRDSLWELSADLPGWWAKQASVRVPAEGALVPLEIPVWRTVSVTGTLVPPKSEKALQEVTVSFGSLATRQRRPGTPPNDAVTCPVQKEGTFRCLLPAGRIDLAVRPKGFVPHYRWGVPLEPGRPFSLGRLALKAGASLTARIETEAGPLPPGRTLVRLLPLQAPGPGAATAEQLQGTAAEAPVGAEGFVQLTELRPGAYILEVRHPEYAPARVHPIEILAGQESVLADPVVLHRPLRLELALRPEVDWLNQPWKLQLRRFSEATGVLEPEAVFEAPVGTDGLVAIQGQNPGRYWMKISDSRGNGMHFELFEVTGPSDARRDVEIEVITVEGLLKLGKEPLRGTLAFGGERGAVSVTMEADEEGRFAGVLPREGVWRVDVEAASPEISTHVKTEVRADRLGRSKIEISLPDTRLFGRVLTERDRPAAGARVEVSTPVFIEQVETDEKGEFVFRALPEGPSQLAARYWTRDEGKSTSDWAFITLTDGGEAGPVDLRLRRVKPLTGRIESLRGPVAGATVRITPLRPLLGFGATERTSLDGSFSVEVPGASELLQVVVAAPGLTLKAFEVQATESRVVLFVSEHSGLLEVEVPWTSEQAAQRDLRLIVFQNGLPLGWQELRDWARANGARDQEDRRYSFPSLASGEYRACLAPQAVIPEWAITGWVSTAAACASGLLGDGGTLRLKIEGTGTETSEVSPQSKKPR